MSEIEHAHTPLDKKKNLKRVNYIQRKKISSSSFDLQPDEIDLISSGKQRSTLVQGIAKKK